MNKHRIIMSVFPMVRWAELGKCPRCGDPDPKLIEEGLTWYVHCFDSECGYEIGPYSDRREALIDWNSETK